MAPPLSLKHIKVTQISPQLIKHIWITAKYWLLYKPRNMKVIFNLTKALPPRRRFIKSSVWLDHAVEGLWSGSLPALKEESGNDQ
jgi:hypothetical protein